MMHRIEQECLKLVMYGSAQMIKSFRLNNIISEGFTVSNQLHLVAVN